MLENPREILRQPRRDKKVRKGEKTLNSGL